ARRRLSFAGQKGLEMRQNGVVAFNRAHRHAQMVWHSIAGEAADSDATLLEILEGFGRRLAPGLGQLRDAEIANTVPDFDTPAAQARNRSRQLPVIVRQRFFDERLVLDGCDAGRLGRDVDVERHADAFDRVDYMPRRIGPSETQARKTIELGKRSRDDDVVVL